MAVLIQATLIRLLLRTFTANAYKLRPQQQRLLLRTFAAPALGMAPVFTTLRATARPGTAFAAPTRSSFGPVPRFQRSRMIVVKTTEPSEPPTADASPEDYEIPRTGRDAPMSETKRAGTPEQR